MKNPVILSLLFASLAHAETKPSALFSDRMVFQREQSNPVWGWDDPGTEVTVEIAGQSHTAKTAEDGRWEVKLTEMPASAEAKEMKITGTSEVVVKDILVGEVWLCSGQSNMGWLLGNSFGEDLTKLAADLPQLRLMTMPRIGTQEVKKDFNGKWEISSAQSAGNFSAVGYYFGKTLHEILGVPVGLINNAWGGSAAEAWVQRDVLEKDGRYASYIEGWKKKEAMSEKGGMDEETTQKLKGELSGQHRPGNLYAGTLSPAIGYGIRGAIWYQGETNAGRAYQYDDLMNLLITTWRKDWGQGDFPFYFVQLADFQDELAGPGKVRGRNYARHRRTLSATFRIPDRPSSPISAPPTTSTPARNALSPKDSSAGLSPRTTGMRSPTAVRNSVKWK